MIILCGTVAATGLMSYRKAYHTPLALLYQLQHYAYVHNGLVCRWAEREPLPQPIETTVKSALTAWQRTVDMMTD